VASLPSRPEATKAASGSIGTAAVTPPPAPTAPSQDVLKLSKSDATKSGSGRGGAGSQDRVNALQEEVTAKDKALKEAQSRVADLEKQIRDMQRLLDLKGGAAAKPGDTKVATAPPVTPAKAGAQPEPTKAPEPAKAAQPEPAKVTPVEPPKTAVVEPVKPAEPPKTAATEPPKTAATEPPKTEAPPAETKPAPPPAAPKKAAPPPKEWYEDIDPMYLAAGGAAIIGIPLIAFLLIRRRRNRYSDAPSSVMTSAFPSDLKPNTGGASKPGGGLVDTGNSSFLTDFDKTGPGTIDTDEVDPVAEAEVYIAYGRDAQAEEILKEAMARDKGRHEIALKLLEIYHARKSATAFETVAKELKASVGESSPMWQKAAAMGAQIDPTNPLYAGASTTGFTSATSAPAAKPDVDFDLEGKGGAAAAPAPDFDLDLDSQKGGTGSAASDLHTDSSPSIDFDLAPSASAAPAADVAAEAPKEEKPGFDFDLSGLDFPSKSEPKAAPAPASSGGGSLDLADLNLDTPHEAGGGGGGGGEAVGTKLELAKAYLEIGDKDGARDILQEVAREGSAAQKEEANKLIASL